MLGCGACVLVPGMLRMFFALALMPFAVEMVVKPCLKKYVIRGYLIHTYDMSEGPACVPRHFNDGARSPVVNTMTAKLSYANVGYVMLCWLKT